MNFKQKFKSGGDVLQAEGLSKGFDARGELFCGVDIDIKRGEHVCLIGANCVGKTTLLKILSGKMSSDDGWTRMGHNVLAAYYDQEQELLAGGNSVLEELTSSYRLYSDTEMRNILGRFLFRGDAVFQRISSLSGGERARLALLKLMLSGANLLLLDEPTNHLDISSKEVFEEALRDFPGAALIVSHDRYFLNRIPSRIVELTAGGLVSYAGGYDYYLEKKEINSENGRQLAGSTGGVMKNASAKSGADAVSGADRGSESEERRRADKALQAGRRRKERELAALEDEISALENRIATLEEKMCAEAATSDHAVMREYGEKLQTAKDELAAAYDRWGLVAAK
jgi:ATP-binding cassette subfamily F protein 3